MCALWPPVLGSLGHMVWPFINIARLQHTHTHTHKKKTVIYCLSQSIYCCKCWRLLAFAHGSYLSSPVGAILNQRKRGHIKAPFPAALSLSVLHALSFHSQSVCLSHMPSYFSLSVSRALLFHSQSVCLTGPLISLTVCLSLMHVCLTVCLISLVGEWRPRSPMHEKLFSKWVSAAAGVISRPPVMNCWG